MGQALFLFWKDKMIGLDYSIAACAAATRAMGTRYGLQLT